MEFLNPSYGSSPIGFHGFDSNRELEKVPAAESAPAPAPEVAPAASGAGAGSAAGATSGASTGLAVVPNRRLVSDTQKNEQRFTKSKSVQSQSYFDLT